MAGDRYAALMVQAAAERAVDFAQADLLAVRWWEKLKLILDHIDRQNTSRLLETAHRQNLAALSNSDLNTEHYWRDASKIFSQLMQALRPWSPSAEEVEREAIVRLSAAWTNVFGDQNSSEVQMEIDRLIRFWDTEASKK